MKTHSHVVLYQAYRKNPFAASRIIAEAKRLLEEIPGIDSAHVAKVLRTGRAVGSNEYDVLLNIIFRDTSDFEVYMKHPRHLEFARFVLHGYMLAGSTSADPEAEFIDYILTGAKPRLRVRNPAVPDDEVVWGDEVVYDAADE